MLMKVIATSMLIAMAAIFIVSKCVERAYPFLGPALPLHMQVRSYAFSHIWDGGQIEIDGKTCKRGFLVA